MTSRANLRARLSGSEEKFMFREIFNGDSLQILKNYVADDLIDIIITSPPYNKK